MIQLQRHIIEFTHPGLEYIPGKRRASTRDFIFSDGLSPLRTGVRQWNELDKHRRKFIHSAASYVEELGQEPKSGPISFWGEWEAQSWAQELALSGESSRPRLAHYPFLDENYQDTRNHNTDPFVFGDHFWYTNCKQRSGGVTSRLLQGSVILFGTEFKEGFRLDTVFVVGDSWQQDLLPSQIIDSAPAQLKATNFDHKNLCRDPDRRYLRFYQGQSYAEDSSFFSFVPCRASGDGLVIHDRVLLSPWQSFNLTKKPGAKTICAVLLRDEMKAQGVTSLDEDKTRFYWHKIASYCIDQGYQLATQIKLPPLMRTEEVLANGFL